MSSTHEHKSRKFVPRFRRRNANLVDADDQEAQALIENELRSHFTWTSDLTEDSKHQFDHFDQADQMKEHTFISDHMNESFSYDIHNNEEQLWKIHLQENEYRPTQWNDDQSQEQHISLSIKDEEHQRQWTLFGNNEESIQLNLNDPNDRLTEHHFDTTNENKEHQFLQGEEFRQQMKFAIESENEEMNLFPNDSKDLQRISFDSTLPSLSCILSLPQAPIILQWLEGISQYTLSLPGEQHSKEYSPVNEGTIQIDSENLKSLKWSIEVLKENLLRSYLISLPNHFNDERFSLPEEHHLKLSMDEENNEQLFSLIDSTFKQTLSLSSNDIKEQLLSIIDSIQTTQNFGNDEQWKLYQWSLEELKTLVQNISPKEFLDLLYSPNDAKPIEIEKLFIECDEGSARAFRRYRCKHISIKTDQNDQLDSEQGLHLQFKGNEQIAIGEEQIQNDLDQESLPNFDDRLSMNDDFPQCYDVPMADSPPVNVGPCLRRSDYERDPPRIGSRFRREIGYISYDASLEQPTYYLDKSFKRFVHIPKDREKCSYDVYRGYEQFLDNCRLNPHNSFRPFDATDLRPLLHWYIQKRYLFSSTDPKLLKPPTFICRRTVLRTILANLYSDSDPWKLLVIRIKGQFYLALANQATKKVEEMTEDEYSGYRFEQLFTTDQPNTTRFEEKPCLEKAQHQFHTVQYWQLDEFNILYSNEIDGEIGKHPQEKEETSEPTKTDYSTAAPSTENIQPKAEEIDWWQGEVPVHIDIPPEQVEEQSKDADLHEEDEKIEDDKVEKKKRNDIGVKDGYIEMKCTNKKIFYRDENKLHTLHWWAQMWLANINTLMIGYKSSNNGIVEQIDLFSIEQFIAIFYSRFNLYLKYCFSYLHSFLRLIQQTVHIDDPNTIHLFTYIPQPLELDPYTGKVLQMDLPNSVPFRYTTIQRSNQRHHKFMPQSYLNHILRTDPQQDILKDKQAKTVEEETKKRIGHRGRSNCVLKQQKQIKHQRKT